MTKATKKRTAVRFTTPLSNRPKPGKAGQKRNRVSVRPGTKQSAAIEMLRSPGGATIAALTKATGWQSHSVRGFLAAVVRKRTNVQADVRFGSKADIRAVKRHIRFTPESGHLPASRARNAKPPDARSALP